MIKRIYLGPAHTQLGRKVIRVGLLGLLTVAVLIAPFQRIDPAPVASDRVALQRSSAPGIVTPTGVGLPSVQPMTAPPPAPEITVTTTTTSTGTRMPHLSGLDGASARKQLQELGVRGITMKAVNGGAVIDESKLIVVGVSHLPGEKITADTAITLMLGRSLVPRPTRSAAVQPPPPVGETKRPEPSASSPVPEQATSSPKPAPDPRFGTCREANAHGYEGYRQGIDIEYDWYEDRDSDGVACER
ncbi:excalibur calcium-binding domain-containing protein [Streptosporangium lutulentum]|uniref:PASTA domain-containing protein n=1 Tax=Streptosporangium lutulentum TaxID=1461250 RepID=A0ABT9QUI4_9ACTN|nr:excalibur calcium-binding domain-containing protein [Streptosporangium lutulentum]MDP9849664.1 hypothetical protein [Streptosporangium lutulentum]